MRRTTRIPGLAGETAACRCRTSMEGEDDPLDRQANWRNWRLCISLRSVVSRQCENYYRAPSYGGESGWKFTARDAHVGFPREVPSACPSQTTSLTRAAQKERAQRALSVDRKKTDPIWSNWRHRGTLSRLAPCDCRRRKPFGHFGIYDRSLATLSREFHRQPAGTTVQVYIEGSPGRTRTYDPPVNSRLLYQLSYRGMC